MDLKRVANIGWRYLRNADYRFSVNASLGLYNSMPDAEYLKRLFKARTRYPLNLDNPKTFNEKLQWLKLYYRKPEFTEMVDKYAVKRFVAERIGEQYVIPNLGVWERFEEIDFDLLPNQFVLKCTHDSGGLVICKDKGKLDIEAARKKIEKCLKKNYYLIGREWPYKDVEPRILAEAYMEDAADSALIDYKVMCFHGEAKLIQVHNGRFVQHMQDFYDTLWNRVNVTQGPPQTKTEMEKPVFLDEMLRLSAELSKDLPHLRVDWYYVNNQLYLGELTFFDASGFEAFEPHSYDLLLGDWITLPAETTQGEKK